MALDFSTACVPRDRLNADRGWGNDAAGALDLSNSTQRDHLTLDVIVAEELGVRYADARTAAPRGPMREQCLAKLFPGISSAHNIKIAEVEAARGRREGLVDTGVIGLFALAYGASSVIAVRRIRRLFFDSPWIAGAALLIAALPIAFVATAIARYGFCPRLALQPWRHEVLDEREKQTWRPAILPLLVAAALTMALAWEGWKIYTPVTVPPRHEEHSPIVTPGN